MNLTWKGDACNDYDYYDCVEQIIKSKKQGCLESMIDGSKMSITWNYDLIGTNDCKGAYMNKCVGHILGPSFV